MKNNIGEVVLTKNGNPLYDRNGTNIKYGDIVYYQVGAETEICIILYSQDHKQAVLFPIRSMWYGDNKFDSKSYGKAYVIKLDNGSKMQLRIAK